jgi:hypothetical protein
MRRELLVVVAHVRKKCEESGALDRSGQRSLMISARPRDSPRHDFPAIGDVSLEPVDVLVIDDKDAVLSEATGLSAPIVADS